MGNLLRLLSHRLDHGGNTDRDNVYIDLETCQPSEAELDVHNSVSQVLLKAEQILGYLQEYPDASHAIRTALSDSEDTEAQQEAWKIVSIGIHGLREAYQFSLELQEVIPALLLPLCSSDRTAREHLEQQQALFTQFALVVDFVIRFDEKKVLTPSMNNDISYYKRAHRKHQDANSLSEEEIGRLSIFFAHHSPMMHLLSESTAHFVAENKNLPVNTTSECLAAIADICCGLITNTELRSRLQRPEETVPMCHRVMTGVCVLYDHVNPLGVFNKGSLLDVSRCIVAQRNETDPQLRSFCDRLINVLRFSSRTLNFPQTPKSTKSLLLPS